MAQVWRFPCTPLVDAAGVAVTAAALTGSGIAELPQVPSSVLVKGAHLSLHANFEVTSTSATPTVVMSFYAGAVGSVIGSKILIAASPALVINVAATSWPGIMKWDGRFSTLSPTAGVLHGSGAVKSGFSAAGGLAAQLQEFPLPITLALRTVSTFNTSVPLEIDVGVTLSSVTGTPSVLVTDLFAELSG
jgi:hypothetical protein